MRIRRTTQADYRAVLAIARDLVSRADTYAFAPDTPDASLWSYWHPPDPAAGYVALSGIARAGGVAAAATDGAAAPIDGAAAASSDAPAMPTAADPTVAGIFVLRPNHPGPGAHIANASFAVHPDWRGQGIGRAMGEAALRVARGLGFDGMQFNIVVSENHAAVRLWQSLGFAVVGTIPGGFRMPDGRYVDHHLMFRALNASAAASPPAVSRA